MQPQIDQIRYLIEELIAATGDLSHLNDDVSEVVSGIHAKAHEMRDALNATKKGE